MANLLPPITDKDLDRYQEELNRTGLPANEVLRKTASIKSFVLWAKRSGYIGKTPSRKAKSDHLLPAAKLLPEAHLLASESTKQPIPPPAGAVTPLVAPFKTTTVAPTVPPPPPPITLPSSLPVKPGQAQVFPDTVVVPPSPIDQNIIIPSKENQFLRKLMSPLGIIFPCISCIIFIIMGI